MTFQNCYAGWRICLHFLLGNSLFPAVKGITYVIWQPSRVHMVRSLYRQSLYASEIRHKGHGAYVTLAPSVFSDNPNIYLCEHFSFCFWEWTIACFSGNVNQQCSNSICRAVGLHQLQIWSMALIIHFAFVWSLTDICVCVCVCVLALVVGWNDKLSFLTGLIRSYFTLLLFYWHSLVVSVKPE